MFWILLITAFLATITLVVFVVLVVGIRIDDRYMGVTNAACGTRTEMVSRRILGVYVRRPSEVLDCDHVRR